jgi:hypothetical protein
MKLIVNVVLLWCLVSVIDARKKCGFVAEKCVLLSSGKVWWPSDWTTQCSQAPICPSGYRLHKQMLGKLRACCCIIKHLNTCPDCDMSQHFTRESFHEWIELNANRNGPQDGICRPGMMKRIFFGEPGTLDKCCCEPKDSPFIYQLEAEK